MRNSRELPLLKTCYLNNPKELLMLSTQYRLKLEDICRRIVHNEAVQLEEIIWAEKLAKSNTTARTWLSKARRASHPEYEKGSTDEFLNLLGIGDPDPSNHRTGFSSAEDIQEWFKRDNSDDWRQRD